VGGEHQLVGTSGVVGGRGVCAEGAPELHGRVFRVFKEGGGDENGERKNEVEALEEGGVDVGFYVADEEHVEH